MFDGVLWLAAVIVFVLYARTERCQSTEMMTKLSDMENEVKFWQDLANLNRQLARKNFHDIADDVLNVENRVMN